MLVLPRLVSDSTLRDLVLTRGTDIASGELFSLLWRCDGLKADLMLGSDAGATRLYEFVFMYVPLVEATKPPSEAKQWMVGRHWHARQSDEIRFWFVHLYYVPNVPTPQPTKQQKKPHSQLVSFVPTCSCTLSHSNLIFTISRSLDSYLLYIIQTCS